MEVDGTVRENDNFQGTPLVTAHPLPFEAAIPSGTQALEVWFHNFNGTDGCSAFDSNLGQNYRFHVASAAPAPVAWAGNFGGSMNRMCSHVDGMVEPIVLDSYMRERACTFVDTDVWVPGLTYAIDLHPEQLFAQVEFQRDGEPLQTAWLQFEGRVQEQLPLPVDAPAQRDGADFLEHLPVCDALLDRRQQLVPHRARRRAGRWRGAHDSTRCQLVQQRLAHLPAVALSAAWGPED